MVTKGQEEHLDVLDKRDSPVNQDQLECQESQDDLVNPVQLVQTERMETLELLG